jgi:tricorn protease
MKSSLPIIVLLVVLGMCSGMYAEPVKFVRYPHIFEDTIVFTYHGDIWVADADGANPYRLTVHVARDVFPRFSPDGQWVAFSSNRMGNDDIWVIPVTGGEPRQLTFHTSNDTMLYWTPDGRHIVFATSRRGTFYSPLYKVSVEGGLPVPLDIDFGAAGMFSQDGKYLAYNRMGFRYWRKHYRGNYNTDIWVRDFAAGTFTQLTDQDTKQFRRHTQDAYPMWGRDGKIYFMSERDDIFNIWKIAPGGGEPVQVTFHEKDGIQYPSISPDGETIVYENEFELWRLDIPDGKPQRIQVSMEFDLKENLVQYLHVDSMAEGFSPSPDGSNLVVDSHGEIFEIPSDPEFGEKTQVTASPWRDRGALYSPDGKYLCYISDESGDDELWLHTLATGERRRLTRHESQKRSFIWSQDSRKIAFVASNRLFLVAIPGGEVTELAYNQARGFYLGDFSQDGKWIGYGRQDDDSNLDIYLFDIAAGKEYNVTRNPFRDYQGEFTPDDGHLVFVSNRDNGVNHLFVLPLKKQTEDPDDPLVKARKKKQKNETKGKEDEKGAPALALEMDRIDRRAVQLTRGENPVGVFFLSKDGITIYFTSRDQKGPGLFSIGIDGKDRKKVVDGDFQSLQVSADRKAVFYLSQNSVYMMPLASKKPKKIEFNLVVTVDLRREWEQIFEESWRVMKYLFYDENMHGYDWDALKAEYKPLLKYVGENQDLYDLTNEMIGELNASHTGVSGPTQRRPDTYRTRFPGFEMEPGGDFYKVSHIYWNGPADKEWIDLKVGQYVLAVDGRELKVGDNYWKVLNHTLNDYVTITVNSGPSMEGAHEVRVKTEASLRNIKYEEWIKKNRDYVEKLTNSEIAYVHIRSMNRTSLQKFENEIDQFHNRKGIIVDIRYNGGGNIDQQLLDILERRPYEYWNNRWSSRAQGRRPRQAIVGPKVMLINWRSASDSEVTPMGFRDLGLGRIVGTPTYGAVIATGSYRLINGGRIRTPGSLVVTYDPTKPNNYGINLENYGVAPDVWVENTPEDEVTGYDRELKAAVDEVLRMLKEGTWRFDQK